MINKTLIRTWVQDDLSFNKRDINAFNAKIVKFAVVLYSFLLTVQSVDDRHF